MTNRNLKQSDATYNLTWREVDATDMARQVGDSSTHVWFPAPIHAGNSCFFVAYHFFMLASVSILLFTFDIAKIKKFEQWQL